MKILHVSDLHFHQPWFRWVAAHAGDFDAVAISGDLLDLFHRTPVESQIPWVCEWLASIEVPLVVCSGNHDVQDSRVCTWLSQCGAVREQVFTDRQILRQGKCSFEAVPFGKLPLRGGEHHIVVTHVPPAGAPTACWMAEGIDGGDMRLARSLATTKDAPRLLLSGHVHLPRRWHARAGSIWSFNPGSSPEAHPLVPNHIAVDLARGTASWADGRGARGMVALG
jgi:predicted phosphodiesterase